MPEPDDMTPVTRGELRAEFADFERRFEQKLDQKLDQKLELWTGALLARFETRMQAMLDARDQRLMVELARHVRSIDSDLSVRVSVLDDKYADVPARLAILESKHTDLDDRVGRLEGVESPSPVRK